MTAHGTRSKYCGDRCRCGPCTAANRVYLAALRVRLAARPDVDVPHGTAGGYTNWACRCDRCSAAHRVRMVASWARRKAARVAS